MKLILQKDVKNLGKVGEQVLVKKGYARNFLVPKGYALPLNKARLKTWKHQQTIISAKKKKVLLERKQLIEKISSLKLKFEKESLKDGRLFGSITAHEISQALEKNHNFQVDKRDISPSLLKTTGDHTINITLDSEHKTTITVSVKGKVTKKEDSETDEAPKKKAKSLLEKAKSVIALKKKDKAEEASPTETANTKKEISLTAEAKTEETKAEALEKTSASEETKTSEGTATSEEETKKAED